MPEIFSLQGKCPGKCAKSRWNQILVLQVQQTSVIISLDTAASQATQSRPAAVAAACFFTQIPRHEAGLAQLALHVGPGQANILCNKRYKGKKRRKKNIP